MGQQPTAGQWTAIQALFLELVDLGATERDERLAGQARDPFILAQVESLLAAADADGILDRSLRGSKAEVAGPRGGYQSLEQGARIGAFVIERLIGRGGMGEIYAARRDAGDFAQRVALKLLRPEAAGQAALFDRERRLLAGLEHPGIARLIDGGIAPDGRPYMAMEFVDGVPIDHWCRDAAADLTTRLRLFGDVCAAVGFAHANLVVHHDLKPSNILVDADGRVRLLDFGIARLLGDDAMIVATQALATPDYAAPEQLDNRPTTVATDIYALGAILFELLTGRPPWRSDGAPLSAVLRRILHDDPPLPSRVADKDGVIGPEQIRGDLDSIILKAMRREPVERYASAGDLAADIRRHLAHRPVAARGGSAAYMFGRFVRRNRWAAFAAVAALTAIVGGSAGIAYQARQTAIERDVALAEARRSEAIVRMLTVMFRDTADAKVGDSVTVKQMLDLTARRLVASLDTSAKSATLITTLSDLYVNLEDTVGADSLLRAALAKGIGKDDPVATAQINLRLAATAGTMNKPDAMGSLLDSADAVFATDPERFRAERLEVISGRANLARREGDYDKAISLLRDAMPEADRVNAENHRDLLTLYNNLLVYMVEANRLDAMPAVFARADAALKRTGEEASMSGLAITQLKGVRLMKLGDVARAERIFTDVSTRRRALFGESAGLAVDLLQLGRARMAVGRYAEARAAFTEARPMALENLGPAALPTLIINLSLAEAMAETGDTSGADRLIDETAPLVKALAPTGLPHGVLGRARAVTRWKQGRIADARTELDRSDAIFKALGTAGQSYLKSSSALRTRMAARR